MLKRGEPKEKVEISSKDFTKRFIKNFILNGLMTGIVLAIIYELIVYFINNTIIKDILYFGLIFFAINKIHVAAIKDTFFDSYILGDDIRKSKNNITFIFIVIVLADIIWSIISLTRLSALFESLGTIYLKQFIIKAIINIVLYAIVIVFCRDAIDKECEESYMANKNYLTKKIILITVFVIIVIIGTIINNQPNKLISQDGKEDNKGTVSNIQDNNLQLSNEINLQLLNEANIEYPSYSAQSNDGKIELKISSFATKINDNEEYKTETISDGVLVFYTINENNFVEKLDFQGNSKWKINTEGQIHVCVEVLDGLFMVGTNSFSKDFVLKIDKVGNIINSNVLGESISNISFIESEEDIQNGSAKIVAKNSEGKNVIISFDNTGNQENVSYIKFNNTICQKIIEKNGYYYGIGKDTNVFPPHKRVTNVVFKLDNNWNEVFHYSILQKNIFNEEITAISDIEVNNEYIFISTLAEVNDVFVFDLNANLKTKFGYSVNNKLNKDNTNIIIKKISSTNDGIYVLGAISSSQKFIDKISNTYNLEYRFNIPDPEEFGLRTSIYSGRLIENLYRDANMYNDYSIVIHQYKLY